MLSQVPRNDEGLEAIIFTAQGDMRQALNNLQSTYAGFGFVSAENVFKVRGLRMWAYILVHNTLYDNNDELLVVDTLLYFMYMYMYQFALHKYESVHPIAYF